VKLAALSPFVTRTAIWQERPDSLPRRSVFTNVALCFRAPPRTSGGFREFNENDLETLMFFGTEAENAAVRLISSYRSASTVRSSGLEACVRRCTISCTIAPESAQNAQRTPNIESLTD